MSTEEVNVRCPICNETSPQGYILCPFCGADLTITYETKIFAPVTYKDVWQRFKGQLLRPRVTAQEIADNPDSKAGFLFSVIIGFGLALQVIAFILHTHLLDAKFYIVILLVSWIIMFLLPLLLWLIGSLAIRITNRLFSGKANKKQIRSAVGYGLMPVAFAELFNGIFYLIALPWRTPNEFDFYAIFDAMLDLRNSFSNILGIIIHFLGLFAAIVYMIFIIKPASEFSWVETVIATSIPSIIFIILLITYYTTTSLTQPA
ncbi:MAG: hypothetical protein FK734_01715 [Asgard group archaeon]|nr:hypothetical protein [Asgard group archaeon]